MSTINKVQLTGNLGSNPEIKTFENGNKVARFSMATKEEYTTAKKPQIHNGTMYLHGVK